MKSYYHRITAPVADFVRAWHGYIAVALLTLMFGLSFGSMVGDSAIVDELAHIPASYSYLHYGDYRLNPEHPPLIKDLAGLPLQFMHLKFPDNLPAWTTDVNGQWEMGWNFLYHVGNDANSILFWARLPILLLAVAFGGLLYWLARRRWGTAVGLLTLFFYTLSPNIIAHSHYVTTDIGASIFIFIAIVTFARFVEHPVRNNFILLSLALAGAQLTKFSAIMLYPFLGVVTLFVVWILKHPATVMARLRLYTGGFIAASGLSVVWIWAFYIPHTINMSLAVQDRLIAGSLPDYPAVFPAISHTLTFLSHSPLLRPLVQYALGVSMVYARVKGGNITYFNGMVTDQSFHGYFPELFVFKTQIALLILMIAATWFVLWRRRRGQAVFDIERVKHHLGRHILEWSLGIFAAFYFWISVASNLNLGIRHILPVYLPIFVLTAIGTVKLARYAARTKWRNSSAVAIGALLVWYAASTIFVYPSFTAYFNEFAGGPAGASASFADSSVDWGQDMKRMKTYIEDHPEIHHFAMDYFGGADARYYFCQRAYDDQGHVIPNASGYDCSKSKYEEWHAQYGPYTGQYIAVSETYLEDDRYYSMINNTPSYQYLRDKKPIAQIGYSIYLYKLY